MPLSDDLRKYQLLVPIGEGLYIPPLNIKENMEMSLGFWGVMWFVSLVLTVWSNVKNMDWMCKMYPKGFILGGLVSTYLHLFIWGAMGINSFNAFATGGVVALAGWALTYYIYLKWFVDLITKEMKK